MAQISNIYSSVGLAQDIALLLSARACLVNNYSLTERALKELKTFSFMESRSNTETPEHLTVRGVTPRQNELDAKAILNFSLKNEAVVTASMSADSLKTALEMIGDGENGLVFAMYRREHVIASCLALAQVVGSSRKTIFIFEDAETSPSSRNLWSLFADLSPEVIVLSTAPKDLVSAARYARDGAVLALAADVLSDFGSAFSVPWGGGVRSVMTGPAFLSAKGRSRIVAATPILSSSGQGDIRLDEIRLENRSDGLLGLYQSTIALWDAFGHHADGFAEATRSFPARTIVAQITTLDLLRQCLANMTLVHPPLITKCPSLGSIVSGQLT